MHVDCFGKFQKLLVTAPTYSNTREVSAQWFTSCSTIRQACCLPLYQRRVIAIGWPQDVTRISDDCITIGLLCLEIHARTFKVDFECMEKHSAWVEVPQTTVMDLIPPPFHNSIYKLIFIPIFILPSPSRLKYYWLNRFKTLYKHSLSTQDALPKYSLTELLAQQQKRLVTFKLLNSSIRIVLKHPGCAY